MSNKLNCIVRSKSLMEEASFVSYPSNSCASSEVSSASISFETDTSMEGCKLAGDTVFAMLEQKIDSLSDLFFEQCRLLTEIRHEVGHSTPMMDESQNKLVVQLLKKALAQRVKALDDPNANDIDYEEFNSRARSLLDAIQFKQTFSLDREIRDALVDFLQSDELKQHMVSATVESMRELIRDQFTRDLSSLYLPLLERWHRRLASQVTRVLEAAFTELEENSASYSHSMFKTSRSLRHALERHQGLLEGAGYGRGKLGNLQIIVQDVLQKELKQWRQEALDSLFIPPPEVMPETPEPESPPPLDYSPNSPPQPADPEVSIIDQLMMSAEINKKIQDGDVNGSFEKALSAKDLALVMTACRGADPGAVFTPSCRLSQPVLLSLVQQLATDLVHDTQLKCRYLEEALINLNTSNPDTRAHLPLVLGEVRKHLTTFLTTYPSHLASRRVALIVMVANNLLI